MKKVISPAVRKPDGKIVKGKTSHDAMKESGQRGFILSDGSFANRGKAAKVASKAGQAKVKKLHSSDLK